MTKPAGNTFEASETDARMDAIRLKEMLGEALTEQELMCIQIERNGFGCGTCAPPADYGA